MHPPVLTFRRTVARPVELGGRQLARRGQGRRLPRLGALRRAPLRRSAPVRPGPRAERAPRLRPGSAPVPRRRVRPAAAARVLHRAAVPAAGRAGRPAAPAHLELHQRDHRAAAALVPAAAAADRLWDSGSSRSPHTTAAIMRVKTVIGVDGRTWQVRRNVEWSRPATGDDFEHDVDGGRGAAVLILSALFVFWVILFVWSPSYLHVPIFLWLVVLLVVIFFPIRWWLRRQWTLVAETAGSYEPGPAARRSGPGWSAAEPGPRRSCGSWSAGCAPRAPRRTPTARCNRSTEHARAARGRGAGPPPARARAVPPGRPGRRGLDERGEDLRPADVRAARPGGHRRRPVRQVPGRRVRRPAGRAAAPDHPPVPGRLAALARDRRAPPRPSRARARWSCGCTWTRSAGPAST